MACSRLISSFFLVWLVAGLTVVQCAETESDNATVDPYDEQIERAFLIVHKKIFEPDVVIGKNMTVIVSIYNAGGSAAYDVTVEDHSWPAETFSSTASEARASYQRIAAGATVQLKYGVSPLSNAGKAAFQGLPAVVQYRPESDSKDVQLAFSTTPAFYILSKYQIFLRSLLTVGSYLTGGALTSAKQWSNVSYMFAAMALIIGGSWAYNAFSGASKRRRYNKAYAEVSKYD